MNIDLRSVSSINGVALTQPEKNLLSKLADIGLNADDSVKAAGNPMNGISCVCDPVVAALCKFVVMCYANYRGGKMAYLGSKVAIGTFDRVRYLVLRVDSKTYSNIID